AIGQSPAPECALDRTPSDRHLKREPRIVCHGCPSRADAAVKRHDDRALDAALGQGAWQRARHVGQPTRPGEARDLRSGIQAAQRRAHRFTRLYSSTMPFLSSTISSWSVNLLILADSVLVLPPKERVTVMVLSWSL